MTTIQKLEFILNAYKKAVLEVKGNYKQKLNQIFDLNMFSGICFFADVNGFNVPRYIIKRNILLESYQYWKESPVMHYDNNNDPMKGIIERIIILEKELKHHKKWRFLAKYIKP